MKRLTTGVRKFLAYLKAVAAVPYSPKQVAPATAGAPKRPYRVEINTGAGLRKLNVEATNEKEAHYVALATYMKTYFNTRVYPLPYYPKPTTNEQQGAHKK